MSVGDLRYYQCHPFPFSEPAVLVRLAFLAACPSLQVHGARIRADFQRRLKPTDAASSLGLGGLRTRMLFHARRGWAWWGIDRARRGGVPKVAGGRERKKSRLVAADG